jgi:hypothetical protein
VAGCRGQILETRWHPVAQLRAKSFHHYPRVRADTPNSVNYSKRHSRQMKQAKGGVNLS